jgi:hypothetical protein
MSFHIAQLNIARAMAGMDSEVISGFVSRLAAFTFGRPFARP